MTTAIARNEDAGGPPFVLVRVGAILFLTYAGVSNNETALASGHDADALRLIAARWLSEDLYDEKFAGGFRDLLSVPPVGHSRGVSSAA